MKRRGNRRYYQHHEVLMIRRIRDLLYDQGFTISGARNKMQELLQSERDRTRNGEVMLRRRRCRRGRWRGPGRLCRQPLRSLTCIETRRATAAQFAVSIVRNS